MKFQQHYSSSRGNLYTVTANSGKRLLIECGVTWRRLQKALDYDLSNVEGCLLTHEHKDHSKAFREVLQAGIGVVGSQGTLEALSLAGCRNTGVAIGRMSFTIQGGRDFKILPFKTNHDAAEPLGFTVTVDGEHLLFVTDTSHICQRFNIAFAIIALECGYDKDILTERFEAGEVHEELAKRLLSSHMEKSVTLKYLTDYCDLSRCREIHLLHLSDDNIDKEQTRKVFEDRLFISTILAPGRNIR